MGEEVGRGAERPTIEQRGTLEAAGEEPSARSEEQKEIQTESVPIGATAVDKPVEEAEQPLLTPEEIAATLEARSPEATEMERDVKVCGDKIIEENPTERAEVVTDGTPGDGEVVIVTDEGKKIKWTTPRDEAARARAAIVHIYQRRPAREGASRKKSTEERKRTEGGEDKPARSVVELLRRRRRLLINEEPEEEEEDVIFILVDALPNSGPSAPPTEREDS